VIFLPDYAITFCSPPAPCLPADPGALHSAPHQGGGPASVLPGRAGVRALRWRRGSGKGRQHARPLGRAAAGGARHALSIICPCGVQTCCRNAGTCAGAKRESAAGAKPGSGLMPMTCATASAGFRAVPC